LAISSGKQIAFAGFFETATGHEPHGYQARIARDGLRDVVQAPTGTRKTRFDGHRSSGVHPRRGVRHQGQYGGTEKGLWRGARSRKDLGLTGTGVREWFGQARAGHWDP
jgi:hypothetical protein